MAVATIHPIRSTVELSIKYICNPEKTDSQILISSHGCGHRTADLDFKETWKRWNSASKIQARHLIQSFSPEDDVTAEKAHEIRNISDALCYKNRLSVIEHASGIKGISYKEVLERKKELHGRLNFSMLLIMQ